MTPVTELPQALLTKCKDEIGAAAPPSSTIERVSLGSSNAWMPSLALVRYSAELGTKLLELGPATIERLRAPPPAAAESLATEKAQSSGPTPPPSSEPPPPLSLTPPKGRDQALWQEWVERVSLVLEAGEASMTELRGEREAAVAAELRAARQVADERRATCEAVEGWLGEWLVMEGRRRVIGSLLSQAPGTSVTSVTSVTFVTSVTSVT